MKDFIQYFQIELIVMAMFLTAALLEGFDGLIFAGLFVTICFIVYRASRYGK